MIRRLFLFVTTLTLLLTACTDTDSFTTDRNQRLTFMQDTVWLDTLFTGVPSATYGFWVHNRSADGLRISTVRLERGNQTGFRVNVDGTFLNPVAQDLEVRKGDSLLVFVELTAYENHSDEPQRVDDNLLFTLESGVVQRVNLCAYSWDAERLTSLCVERDTTITSVRPLVVYGDGITVAPDATLTLRNTTLYFHGDARLKVEGRLVAEHCVLRGDRLDRMFSYLPYDRISGQWHGIEVAKGAAGCWLTDTEVRNAWDALTADSTRVVLSNSVLHNSRGHGLYAKDSQVELDGCQLSNAEGDCLSLHGCEARVDHCTLAQFYPYAAPRGAALRFGPTTQPLVLRCSNTLMTGYEDDVLQGVERDSTTVDYRFENCLIRTPEVDDSVAFSRVIWESPKDEVQGKQHFATIDEENFIYDYHIVGLSPAYEPRIGRAFKEEDDVGDDTDNEQ